MPVEDLQQTKPTFKGLRGTKATDGNFDFAHIETAKKLQKLCFLLFLSHMTNITVHFKLKRVTIFTQ